MSTLKAIVQGGRAIIENMGEYPDGTELEIAIVGNDQMSEAERAKLDASIDRGIAEHKAGLGVSAESVLADLRAQLP
jgi:hypothetical protein